MPKIAIVQRPEIQRGMILEQLDAIDAEINKHYVAVDELISVKFTLNTMLAGLSSPQCVEAEPSVGVYSLSDYKQNIIEYQKKLAEIDER